MKALMLAMTCLALARPAAAQESIGELLDKGGQAVPAAELKTLLSDADYSSGNGKAASWQWHLAAGGALSGQHKANATFGVIGTWEVDDKGRFCYTERSARPGPHSTEGCVFVYRLGDAYFVSRAPARKPEGVLRKAEIKK